MDINDIYVEGTNETKTEEIKNEVEDIDEFESEYQSDKKSNKRPLIVFLLLLLVVGIAIFAITKNGKAKLSDKFFKSAVKGDEFILGKYEQDNNTENGGEDIEWVVLDNKNGKILAISKYTLDNKAYNDSESFEATDWEHCSLRKWLNNDFYNSAFSDKEKELLLKTNLENKDSKFFATAGGNNTVDNVFLLSGDYLASHFEECQYKLASVRQSDSDSAFLCTTSKSCDELTAKFTDYAKTTYLQAQVKSWKNRSEEEIREDYAEGEEKYGENCSSWWLRSPGDQCYSAICVTYDGSMMSIPAKAATIGVRPVILISKDDVDRNRDNFSRDAIEKGKPVQIVSDGQQIIYVMKDGSVLRMGYDSNIHKDVSGWKDIKKVAIGRGVIVGLTNDGKVNISQRQSEDFNYDESSFKELSDVVDICVYDYGINPKSEDYYGAVICLCKDGKAVMIYNGGYTEITGNDPAVTGISSDYNKFTFLLDNGNVHGEYIHEYSETYDEVIKWSDINQTACGEYFVAGLKKDGTVEISGNAMIGTLFNHEFTDKNLDEHVIQLGREVVDWKDIVYISAGTNYLVGLKKDGTVVASGANFYGQCDVDKWTDITRIEAYGCTTVGFKSDGSYLIAGKDITDNVIKLQNTYDNVLS